ncbi:MAG TPA: hypothetical protein PKG71_00715 [Candidatus Woesebacteria bacterium]|nr:hypothetical protein [Candidatus Woesebacteria bacterium]HNS94475.1 hypothetical protein [Candidatus Woesebacteria bacterium]
MTDTIGAMSAGKYIHCGGCDQREACGLWRLGGMSARHTRPATTDEAGTLLQRLNLTPEATTEDVLLRFISPSGSIFVRCINNHRVRLK